MKAEEFGEYIRNRRNEVKMTIRQLELYTGVSNSYLSQLENGKRGIPSPDILRKLSKGLNTPYEVLMEKAGYLSPALTHHIGAVKPAVIKEERVDYSHELMRRIPIVAEIPCGAPAATEQNIIDWFPVDSSIINVDSADYVWLKAKGDSMIEAGIKDGSLVLIRLQPDVENKEIAAVSVDEENATLKRVLFVDGNVILMPENREMAPMSYPRERIRIIGKAIRLVVEL